MVVITGHYMMEGNCLATSQVKVYIFCYWTSTHNGGRTCPQQNSPRSGVHSSMLHQKDYTVWCFEEGFRNISTIPTSDNKCRQGLQCEAHQVVVRYRDYWNVHSLSMPAGRVQIALCNLQTCARHTSHLGTSVGSALRPSRGQMYIDTIRNSTGTYNWRQLSTFNKIKVTTDTPHRKWKGYLLHLPSHVHQMWHINQCHSPLLVFSRKMEIVSRVEFLYCILYHTHTHKRNVPWLGSRI